MPTYRLHYFPESGNSYKLALMLTLCGETFEPVWTDFSGGVTRTPDWRRTVNEMGEIPVLEEDGVRLTQTAPILLKLADQYGRFGGENCAGEIRSVALAVLGQPQANRLHGGLSLFIGPSRPLRIRTCRLISASGSTISWESSSNTCSKCRSRSETGRPWLIFQ